MHKSKIINIINKAYPKIAKHYGSNAKVELHNNIYERLSGISEMSGDENPHAEYDWSENKIYIYTINMDSEEQVIRSLIHECVHSVQNKELFDAYYETPLTYFTHPYEIEAHYEEENWEKYKLNTISIG
jgi:Zn-dependent peptidase ImmA (M78 family)